MTKLKTLKEIEKGCGKYINYGLRTITCGTNFSFEGEESLKLCPTCSALKIQTEEVLKEIERIKNKHKTLLPDYKIGYDLALKELKSSILGERE